MQFDEKQPQYFAYELKLKARAFINTLILNMQEEKPVVVEVEENVHFGKFTIFLLTKSAQNSYGIKNSDYTRYRKYCSRKIQKLRLAMNFKYGNRTKFFKKDMLKDKHNDNKILQCLLFHVERNWAMANQSKFSQIRKASQKSRGRHFAVKKLRKALGWCKKLNQICQEKTDSLTKLEAEAYQLYIEGLLNFEMQNWNQTQIKLIGCRQIFTDLSKISDSMSERVFKEKIDQIEQTIKFCNFKISKGKELSISEIIEIKKHGDQNLSSLIDSLTEKRMRDINIEESFNEIRFENERYPIKQELIVKHKSKIDLELKNLEEIKKKSLGSLEDEKLYEELLSFYSDIVILTEEAIKITDSEKEDSKKKQKYTQGEIEILKKISLLFTEMKMKIFIDRNLTIFKHSYYGNKGRKSTPQTLAKLLTATSSLYQELAEVIKQKGQISNTFEIEHIHAIDANNFYLRTLRLLFVGQVYFNNDKIKQAYSLWAECERCLKILNSKEEMKEAKNGDDFVQSLISLQKIYSNIRVNKLKCLIFSAENDDSKKNQLVKQVQNISLTEEQEQNKSNYLETTIQNLIFDQKYTNQNITLEEISKIPVIDLPGSLQPAPTRPIFFDIFYTTLQYPNVEKKIKSSPAKSGWWNKLFK